MYRRTWRDAVTREVKKRNTIQRIELPVYSMNASRDLDVKPHVSLLFFNFGDMYYNEAELGRIGNITEAMGNYLFFLCDRSISKANILDY